MISENELIQGIRDKDPGVFEIFVRRFQQQVYYTALRMVSKHEDALDVAQEVFLKVWRFGPKLKKDVALDRWVYRVIVNTCIDRLRQRRHYETQTTSDNIILMSLPEKGVTPHEYAKQTEDLNQIKNALEKLTDRQRSIFVLRHFQNLKIREIADVIRAPVGTVKATLHQTLLKLRSLLGLGETNLSKREIGELNAAQNASRLSKRAANDQ